MNRKRRKRRDAAFKNRRFRPDRQKCTRCSRHRPVTMVERYGVALCKLCTFEMDNLTLRPSTPGMYPR